MRSSAIRSSAMRSSAMRSSAMRSSAIRSIFSSAFHNSSTNSLHKKLRSSGALQGSRSFTDGHSFSEYLRSVQKFHRFLLFAVGSMASFAGVLLYNWDRVKQRVGQEGAEVIREGIRSENLQISAADFSKALLNEILTDEKVVGQSSQWLLEVLKESEDELSSLVVSVLRGEKVVAEVKRLLGLVVQSFCNEQWMQEEVGKLLAAAIYTEYARERASQWLVELLSREAVVDKLQDVVNVSILSDASVRQEASRLANAIVSDVLRDSRIARLAQDQVSQLLNSHEFQDDAGKAAWSVVRRTFAPRWLTGATLAATLDAQEAAGLGRAEEAGMSGRDEEGADDG